MWKTKTTVEISGSHVLATGKCSKMHGHNWTITVECVAEDLVDGMVVDFNTIKKVVKQIDHTHLNDHIENPTAEHIALWVCERIENCYRVTVQESAGNVAIFEHPDVCSDYGL